MPDAISMSLNELADRMGYAARYIDKNIDVVQQEAAKEIMVTMLRIVPRDTGYLASRIGIRHSPGRTEIGPDNVFYAPFVEYGTGERGEFGGTAYEIKPKSENGVLVFMIGGRKVYAKRVTHHGSRPKPYVRPAAKAWLDTIQVSTADVAVKMLTGEKK